MQVEFPKWVLVVAGVAANGRKTPTQRSTQEKRRDKRSYTSTAQNTKTKEGKGEQPKQIKHHAAALQVESERDSSKEPQT